MLQEFAQWLANKRPEYFVTGRKFGGTDLVELSQPAGSFPDPAAPSWQLQLILAGTGSAQLDFGDGPCRSELMAGQLCLSTANTTCDYDVSDSHHLLVFALPEGPTTGILSECDGAFTGHFGQLHSGLWRDNAIRDFMLLIWRASKGDRYAPGLDPDEALLRLSLMLLKRANTKFTPKDFAYRLAPAARRRVMEFIDDNISEDLSLFRLAEIAGLSPYHFARSFRADLGDSPAQYVLRRRLAKAQDLIRNSDQSFTEIAMSAGFSSQSRLNDAFARAIGGTPTQMRREARG